MLDRSLYYQYAVGIAYLLIGLFVYYRRVGAPRSVHFYVLCLASFVLSCFHFTGKLNAFDQVIYWGNVAAGILAPTIFLHFCLVFPERPAWLKRPGASALFYVPGALLLAVYVLVAKGDAAGGGFAGGSQLVPGPGVAAVPERVLPGRHGGPGDENAARRRPAGAAAVEVHAQRRAAGHCAVHFDLLRCHICSDALPGHYQKMAVLSLILLPLTWAYAILRYRLMDVDIIFQQGYVYTLATLVVLGIFYGLIFSFARPEDLSPAAIVGLILFATFIFQPIRDWLQEQLDRYFFYKDRYDYRRTLIEFARELGSETNLDEMLRSVADRLVHTLSIQHVAFFLAGEVRTTTASSSCT